MYLPELELEIPNDRMASRPGDRTKWAYSKVRVLTVLGFSLTVLFIYHGYLITFPPEPTSPVLEKQANAQPLPTCPRP